MVKLSDLLRQSCNELHISLSELARRTGQTPQNLSKKLRRDSMGFSEFSEYMDILGAKINLSIQYNDGETVEPLALGERAKEKISLLQQSLDLEKKNGEYQKRLNRDIRTAVYSSEGYANKALKHIDDKNYVASCLEKIKQTDENLHLLLDGSLFAGAAAQPYKEVDPDAIKGKHILLVEDNETNCEIAKDVLEDNGIVVDVAKDGREAINKLKKSDEGYYGCILMDIQMPNMNGLEATRAIRAMDKKGYAEIPIIAMTANAFESDKRESLETGMNDHLTKPVDAMKLIETVARYL